MKASGVLFLMVPLLVVFSVHRFSDAADAAEVQDHLKGFSDKNSPVLDSNGTQIAPPVNVNDKEKKDGDQDKGLQEETKKVPEKDDSKKSSDEKKDKQLQQPKAQDNNGKQSSDKDSDSKTLAVDSHVEECDPSNRCIAEESKFIACLRVPGKDSLALSLLIQNKGTGSLDVNIVAPSFVNLEQAKVQLQAKENKEVKVSVDSTNDTTIILEAGKGHCSLNLRNTISDSVRRSETSKLSGFVNLALRASILHVLLAAVVLIGAAWLCIRYRQMYHQEDGPKYQKVEVGLPVSTGGKKETEEADGWNNNWGDGWDDEEAPKTPSSILSNPSSKGLASRRLNKDIWKD
ncbi:uncharacterized protein LOC103696379 [Phoenix dactylifera]|uniref:Uncharacterized protein LOC103696379 n=1 Tax=Phoenix dactylifera TaxID=42345 RepID=A0A8B7BGN4_PHODC|nr:uncharacterized protein LOC103696379 [Phoenix dactylifera]